MKQVEPVVVEGRIRIPYRWPVGRVAGRYLETLRREQRFEGLRCSACDRVAVPPRPRCPACNATPGDAVTVGPAGNVTTWTRRAEVLLALVRLDGADTAILHRLIDVDEPRSGMRVTAVLEDGLVGFRPLESP